MRANRVSAVALLALLPGMCWAQSQAWPTEFTPMAYDLHTHAPRSGSAPVELGLNHYLADSFRQDVYVYSHRRDDKFEDRSKARRPGFNEVDPASAAAPEAAGDSGRSGGTETCHAGSVCSAMRTGGARLSELLGPSPF